MRRLMLGIVSTLALTCQAPAQDAVVAPVVDPQGQAPKVSGVRTPAAPGPVVASAAAAPAAATPHAGYTEGQKIEMAGALYSTRDGRIVLKSDRGEIFVLLENQNLWRMEQRTAFGEREFRVRGQVSKYQERYYLSVSKILETGVKLEKKAESDEAEKPFWERLMFWKNS